MVNPTHQPTNQLIAVWVTAPSEASAEAIASDLVEQRMAACVAIAPVRSIYRWQGQIERAQEWQLTIKTSQARFPEVQATVRRLHSYEMPELIALPIVEGSPDYLNWLAAQVS